MNSDNESYQSKSEFFHPETENILHDKENYVRRTTLSRVFDSPKNTLSLNL